MRVESLEDTSLFSNLTNCSLRARLVLRLLYSLLDETHTCILSVRCLLYLKHHYCYNNHHFKCGRNGIYLIKLNFKNRLGINGWYTSYPSSYNSRSRSAAFFSFVTCQADIPLSSLVPRKRDKLQQRKWVHIHVYFSVYQPTAKT